MTMVERMQSKVKDLQKSMIENDVDVALCRWMSISRLLVLQGMALGYFPDKQLS